MHPDIAIFFGRPVRSQVLAEELRSHGHSVTIYNNAGTSGTYTHTPLALFPALSRLFSTRHQIYLTSSCFAPAFSLYLNWLSRGIPYVFNAVGLMAPTYRERSGRKFLGPLAQRWFYPALEHCIYSGARAIVCNSQYLRRRLASEFPRWAPKMLTIYNGIEFERFASGQPMPMIGPFISCSKAPRSHDMGSREKVCGRQIAHRCYGAHHRENSRGPSHRRRQGQPWALRTRN